MMVDGRGRWEDLVDCGCGCDVKWGLGGLERHLIIKS